jgi:hypothetical protein
LQVGYTVSIRYPRDYRSDPQAIATQVLVPMADGGTVIPAVYGLIKGWRLPLQRGSNLEEDGLIASVVS